MVKKILFITLSNIGDVILTLPTLDYLRENYPSAKFTVLVGPRAKDLFLNAPYIESLICYNKKAPLREKIKLFFSLKREKFDIVVDLRNSFFGFFLPSKIKTALFVPKKIKHSRLKHLYKVAKKIIPEPQRNSLFIAQDDKNYVLNLLKEFNIKEKDQILVFSCGARSSLKRWDKEKFLEVISRVIEEFKFKVILIGDKEDIPITAYIKEKIPKVIDLAGKTTILQLAELLKMAKLLISNDSAVLHLGSYLNIPIVAIFGPTDDAKYAPWSEKTTLVKKEIFCRPCMRAQCKFGTVDCMRLIRTEDVYLAIKRMLNKEELPTPLFTYKRILICRTDKIGDVILSTPVIKAMRDNFPCAYIAMMVSPDTKELVEGNPYLDEVIILDKRKEHKGFFGSLKMIFSLRKRKFDLALILHPNRRVHLLVSMSGIKRRIGYNYKWGFLLTDKLKHTKPQGKKHELEYNLDLVRYLGIEPKDKTLYLSIKESAENWLKEFFLKEKITPEDKLLAIHPSATCPSKRWPIENFAKVADRLVEEYNFRVVIVAGNKDIEFADKLQSLMKYPSINLAGKISLSQLISLLRHCKLFISNDSGPVHISSAVGTPVIAIFGRNQPGLSPLRWGPIGKKDKVLHKDMGCKNCLAHNCKKDFACLKAIKPEEVLECVDQMIKN